MMNQQKKMICIRCPMGCQIEVLLKENNEVEVSGSVCKLGREYAKDEIFNPHRILTSLVRVKYGIYPQVSVWTTKPIPKNRIWDVMKELRKFEIVAPVNVNQILIKNILGLGADIETTGNVPCCDDVILTLRN
jgi:CxxC motif-containing protein